MTIQNNKPDFVDALRASVGGDADIGGIAQTITSDDIDAVLYSTQPLEVRKQSLLEMKHNLETRQSADKGDDVQIFLEMVNEALAKLENHT